jgi:DNA-binding MarR family transcriptional regulator
MIENLLTKNEAKVLRMTNANEGSFLYEVASAAQLTPADVMEAADRLDGRGYVVLDRDKKFVRMTDRGRDVRNDISHSSIEDANLKLGRSFIVDTEDVADDSGYEEMSESHLSEAIDAEISKYE